MAGFSPWASSGLLGGAGRRVTVAAGASAALWLAVLWASMGTQPAPIPGIAAAPEAAPAKPAAPPLRLVAAGGMPAPGGGSFNRFGLEMKTIAAPVNARGDVAFFAKLMRAPAEEGLFLWHDGRASPIAAIGGAVPGGGTVAGVTERPTPALNAGGKVAFAATVEGGRASDAVLTWSSGGKLAALAQSGARAPGVPGAAFFDFAPPVLNDAGDAAFLATLRRGRETLDGIFLSAKGQLAKVVAAGDPAPGGGSFAALASPVLNAAGTLAFAGVVEGGPTPGGVFVAEGTRLRPVVGAGDAAPGGGVFARISEHVGIDDAGRVAFGAFLGGGGVQNRRGGGVFLAADGGIAPVALLGGAAPGGGTFAAFGDAPSLASDGSLAFIAAIDGGPGTTGVYASGPDGLRRLAGPGDMTADGRRIADFPLNASVAAGPRGALTFQSTLRTEDDTAEALVLYAPGGR